MKFLDREEEWKRLDRLFGTGGLGVIWGRRRIGKTRLLLEWCKRHGGDCFSRLGGPLSPVGIRRVLSA